MSQDSAVNIMPPPLVPLRKLKEAPPSPLPPPVFPGLAHAAAGTVAVPAPPPKAAPDAQKKKERRLGLAGLEPGDPRSIYHLVVLGLKNALAMAPKLAARYWWQIIIVLGVWYGLGTFNAYSLSQKLPALSSL